ncbi:MAG: 30S ribosome-binding factor RbfA [Dehalococcoidia bacterium]|nr:30S ribosome-binding factor RbfA [Dehalococcoidia bacterium]
MGDLVRSVLADLVRLKVKDPRVSDVLLTFTEVDVAPDLSHARVGVSVMGDEQTKRDALVGLERAAPFLQRAMNKEVRMRRIPRLVFHLDESMEQGDRMTQQLRDIARSEGRDL